MGQEIIGFGDRGRDHEPWNLGVLGKHPTVEAAQMDTALQHK